MNANIRNSGPAQGSWFGRHRRQQGSETVEFALLATFIFLLLFAIIEFSIAMYDQGTLVHSARLGAREASLYWLDVTAITPDSDPEDDQRVKPDWIEETIVNLHRCLNRDQIPAPGHDCDYCAYIKAAEGYYE